ncbi:MAG: hypothetical protein IIA75_06185 [Proteobacteria bacterium]|nr:hypothetical protein [Pseudomonadota bacterium]
MKILSACLAELLAEDVVETVVTLAPDQGRLRAQLFESGRVIRETTDREGKINLELRIEQRNLDRLVGSIEH